MGINWVKVYFIINSSPIHTHTADMKKIGIILTTIVLGFFLLQACGPSEAEKRAAEQARQDSLKAAQEQKLLAAREDSIARAKEAERLAKEEEENKRPRFSENGTYAVQVGAFRAEDTAQKYLDKWKDRDYPNAYVVKIGEEETGDIWFRLRVGYFDDTSQAETFGAELAKEMNSGYWVSKVK